MLDQKSGSGEVDCFLQDGMTASEKGMNGTFTKARMCREAGLNQMLARQAISSRA
jgi:hypothetical protein